MAPRKARFEDILDVVGHFGPFQIVIFVTLTLADLIMGGTMLFFVFANADLGWHCERFENNITLNSSLTTKTCSYNGSQCEVFKYHDSLKSIVTEWNLVCGMKYIVPNSVSIQMVGVLLGTLVAGIVADRFGRKIPLVIAFIGIIISQTMVGLSTGIIMFIVLRFTACFFLGAMSCICFTLPIEFIGPEYRTVCGALGLWGFAQMLLSLFSYLTLDWRKVAYLSGLYMSWLLIPVIFAVPESIRWLIQKEKFNEAEKLIERMAKFNRKPLPDMSILKKLAAQEKMENKKAQKYSYLDLFKTKPMAIKSLSLMFTWFSASTVCYGIGTLYSTLHGSLYINTVISAACNMPIAWSVICTANRFGRKKVFFAYMSLPLVCLIVVLALGFSGMDESAGMVITIMVVISMGTAIAGWILAAIYSAELYPTLMRNIGVGACSMSARLGGIIAPQFSSLAEAIHPMTPYVIYVTLVIISMILVGCFLPETAHKPLFEKVAAETGLAGYTEESEDSEVELEMDDVTDLAKTNGKHSNI